MRIVVLAGLLLPVTALSQHVRGVTRNASGQPVAHAVVELLDGASRVTDRRLTDDSGAFRLTALSDGPHVVRTLRIGFRPARETVVVRMGETVDVVLTLSGVPFTLDTVYAVSRNACRRITADTAGALLDAWYQARTAIGSADVAARSQAFSVTSVAHVRRLTPNRDVVGRGAAITYGSATETWHALPPDSLRKVGYVVSDTAGYTHFYAPGLDALLAETFLTDHCVRFAPRRAGRIGIQFEPTADRRRVSDIKGTMWLDAATSELRSIEFGYTNILAEAARIAEGQVEFARLRDGGWVVSGWNLRMPIVETGAARRARRGAGIQYRVTEIRETGGTLALVMRGEDTLWSAPPVPIIGRLVDSLSNQGVEATLALRGLAVQSVSSPNGQFQIGPVTPGEYTLEIRTPSLESMTSVYAHAVAAVNDGEPYVIKVPNGDMLASSMCPRQPNGGILMGRVTGEDGVSPSGVRVLAEWADAALEGQMIGSRRWVETRTDSAGGYRICGLPMNQALTVRALADSAVAEPVPVLFTRRVARANFALTAGQPGARLTTYVFADSTQQPLAGVSVTIQSLQQSTETSEHGVARLADIAPGRHEVLIRRIGFVPVIAELDVSANETVTRRIFLTRVSVLDSVNVTAQRIEPYLHSFAENQRLGLGKFLTRDDLEKLRGRTLVSVLLQYPKARVRTNNPYADFLETTNTPPGALMSVPPPPCYVAVYIDGVRMRELVNLRSIHPDDLEAVEFYPGPAQTPARYSDLNTHCGVLVLWTRRTP